MTRYSWPVGSQNEASIAGGRLAEQLKARVGLSGWALDASVYAGLAELLATSPDAIDIRSFGASENAANNAPAIQAAIEAAPDFGGEVLIPHGDFTITEPITITGRERIRIGGFGNIVMDGDDYAALVLDGCIRCHLEGFRIIGEGGSTNTATGVKFNDCFHIEVSRLKVRDVKYGLYVEEDTAGSSHEIYPDGCVIRCTDITDSIGIYVGGDDNQLTRNIVRGYNTGIKVDTGANLQRLIGNHTYRSPSSTVAIGIDLVGASGSTVIGNYIDGSPTTAGIYVDAGGTRGITICNNIFLTASASQAFVRFKATSASTNLLDVTIKDNVFLPSGVTVANPFVFDANVISTGSARVYIEGNSFRGSVPTPKSTIAKRTATIANGQASVAVDFSDVLLRNVYYAQVTGGHAETADAVVTISNQTVTVTVGSAVSDDRTVYVEAISQLARDT